MKNLLTILLLLCVNICFSQVQKGTIVIGGGLNLTGSSENNTDANGNENPTSNSNIGIGTNFQKFVNNTTAVGFGLAYNYQKYSSEYENGNGSTKYGNKRNMIDIGPTVTKYISLRDKLYLTVGGGLTVGYGGETNINTDEKSKIWSFGIGIQPGIAFFLNDNFALSAGIGSLYYKLESSPNDQAVSNDGNPNDIKSDYGLTFSLNTFNIGLRYYLRTAKSE